MRKTRVRRCFISENLSPLKRRAKLLTTLFGSSVYFTNLKTFHEVFVRFDL